MSRLRCEGDWPPPGDKLLEQVNIHLWLQDEIIHLLLLYLLQYTIRPSFLICLMIACCRLIVQSLATVFVSASCHLIVSWKGAVGGSVIVEPLGAARR
jgi:hypothetical protein